MAAVATPTFATTRTRILIASADAAFRKRLKNDPLYAESDSEEAVGGAHALSKLAQYPCDSVLLDRNLPDLDALEVAEQIRKRFPRTEVELVDADFAGLDPHESKAQDQDERLAGNGETKAAATTTALIRPAGSARRLAESMAGSPSGPLPDMIGSSHAMQQVYGLVGMVAHRDTTVLVTGETGTGKNWWRCRP